MANIKSAEKRYRQSVKRRARNRAFRSRMRTAITRLRKAIDGADAKAAQELLPQTLRDIDVAAQKGVIHRNAGNRYKSRLVAAVRRIK